MSLGAFQYVYGPVPSRRLGRSLGVDLVPFKTCTYDCVYCQLGRTTNRTLVRDAYVPVDAVLAELERKLAGGDVPDCITLAGSGEPTLHSGIGRVIARIRERTDVPVAVLTNGSLLWMKDVQDDLMQAELVIPSLDAGDDRLFQTVNRPHEELSFERVMDGMAEFVRRFPGETWLEILLLAGVTGMPAEVRKIADLAARIGPARIQLNTVSRPPADEFAFPLSDGQMQALRGLFPEPVDVLCDRTAGNGNDASPVPVEDSDILALLRRRPCTSGEVATGLGIHVADAIKRLNRLIAAGSIRWVVSGAKNVYRATDS
ncbi:MAG: radical SAM protein [Syntrophaceae bacterium]|nr:radical SAM protein [Syntrophaceae bacterium]